MIRQSSETGKMGEDIACRILKKKGYRIMGRNISERFGEIDILAQDSTGVLTFVEVKTIIGDGERFTPEQHFNSEKMRKCKRIAMFYAAEHPREVSDRKGWRVDLVTVLITDLLLTDIEKDCVINHYENV
jgi:putative endonuclease